MTDQQPTTLRLADLLTDPDGRFYDFDIRIAADELRRLQKEEQISAHAKRLALELECLLLDANHPAVSRWWNSAHEALEQYRADVDRLYPQEHVSPLGKD